MWIHNPLAFRIVDGKPLQGPSQHSATCNVAGLADGSYQVEWYDTSSGRVLHRDTASVDHLTHFGYGIELKPPAFWGDIAARIIREDRTW